MSRNNKVNKPVKVSTVTMFKSENDLVVKEDKTRGIITWGKDNLYSDYLQSLRGGQPQHAGILKGKAKYLSGIGIKPSTPFGKEFIDKANPRESWPDLLKKSEDDYVTYGARAYKVIPNLAGIPLWWFHVDYGKLRPAINEDEVVYSPDWSKRQFEKGAVTYPIWYEGCKEISIYIYKNYKPTTKHIESRFPGLEYESGIKSIDTLKRIQNFKNSLVSNNFSSGTVVTIHGGKPETEEEERYIAESLKGEHTGDEKAGNVVVLFTDENSKGATVQSIDASNLDKQFEGVTRSETINVYAAHNAPPDLFNYISDTSTVFDVDKIVNQHELFMNSYVVPNQVPILKMLNEFYYAKTGREENFEIEQFKPIGLDLPLDNQNVVTILNGKDPNIILNYLDKKYALNIPKALLPNGQTATDVISTPIQQVNEHLKNLTGKQTQGIMRIVRKFQNGEYSEVQATLLLKSGFGLTDQECKDFLGTSQQTAPIQQRIAFAKQVDFFALFDKYAHDVNPDDEVLEVSFISSGIKFAEQTDVKTNTAVLNELKKNKDATNEEIATTLGITATAVAAAITWLAAKKLLERVEGTFKITDKGLKAKKTVIYTEYNYDKRPDVSGPAILSTTRDFCRMLYAKFQEGRKALTFDAINNMTNEFGENVWDYKGGWWTQKGTNETTPWCRHGWVGTTKIRYEN